MNLASKEETCHCHAGADLGEDSGMWKNMW
jgi:hypothetical protein